MSSAKCPSNIYGIAAAFSGNFEVVRMLLDYYPADINARDREGFTPLFWASEGRYFKGGSVIRLLLEHGIDINVQNQLSWTPLHLASSNGALRVVRLLLEHDAAADVEAKNNVDKTALQIAADEGHDEVVELLREHGRSQVETP